MRTARGIAALAAMWVALPYTGLAQDCSEEFDSTFALIEKAIFQNKGCNSSACHGAAAESGLDLRPGSAYDSLIDAPVESIGDSVTLRRVIPANKDDSLLWLNLAAATLPDVWEAPLRPMPLGGLPPLAANELEAIRLWIESGAPREGTVPGTAELLDACLPKPAPLQVEPLEPPAPGTGVQLRAPTQLFLPESERETCFITYYDFTGKIPQQFLGPGDTFRYKRISNRQDPLSHHAVVVPYLGTSSIDDPIWGEFRCGGGELDGELCEPTDTDSCGNDGVCASEPMPAVGCIGFGPGDASIGVGNDSLFNTMAPGLSGTAEGLFAQVPIKGILVWNSHGFNVTDTVGKLDIWVNLDFAGPEESLYEVERFTEISAQFGLNVPAFGMQQICSHWQFEPNTNLVEVSSHNHRRGKRFRSFFGRWSCQGGPNAGRPCSPFGPETDFPTGDLCAGAPCAAPSVPKIGDCNRDGVIDVDELLLGIGISLGVRSLNLCGPFDGDRDAVVSVYEIVHAVRDALEPPQLDAEDERFYTSLTYVDPVVVRFDPPRFMGGPRTTAAERTVTSCALYDNGFLAAAEVKRQSTSPLPVRGFPGGPCATPEACTAGRVGTRCVGGTRPERDASCDSSPSADDGECDGCRLRFGTTTDDEMFIISGAFFIAE